MSFSVEWSKAAAKQLLKIPKKQRLIILSWIQDYLDESEHYCLWPCAKALQGSESGWRSRVGVYRILGRFEGRKAIIEVVESATRAFTKTCRGYRLRRVKPTFSGNPRRLLQETLLSNPAEYWQHPNCVIA